MTLANQNNADNAVIRGQEYYRLKQTIDSPGDIFEVDQSTRAIYIGPDSDISEVRVTYYDPESPTGLSTADVSINGPFVGRIDSLLATKIPVTGQKARILVSPVDIVDNTYRRTLTGPFANFREFNVPAKLDLMCALKTLPSIPQVRADRTLRFPNTPYEISAPSGSGGTDLIIPIYGRRMVSVQVVAAAFVGYAMDFYLVALQPGATPEPAFLGSLDPVLSASVGITQTAVIRASSDTRSFVTSGGEPTQPWTTNFSPTIAQGPKGLGDLLVINIQDNFIGGPPAQSTGFIDVYVKLSDKEV